MEILSQVKAIMADLFKATAKKNNMPISNVLLVFKLKNAKQFICRYLENEVNVGDAGLKAKMFSGTINSHIVNGLIKHAESYKIEKAMVNVSVTLSASGNLVLILRNANTAVKEIELADFLNIQA